MDINGPLERHLPVPPGKSGPPPTYIIDDMKPGDSRLFAAHPGRVRAAVWPRARVLGFKLRSVIEGDGVRIWRVS